MTTNPQWESAVDAQWRSLHDIRVRAKAGSDKGHKLLKWVRTQAIAGVFETQGGDVGQFQVRRKGVTTSAGFTQCKPLPPPT